MNCETAIELLPWFLNGTLDPHERTEVQRHLQECEACRLALSDTREAWQTFDQHLPSEAIVALAYDETPAGTSRRAATEHLASCARCAAELEMARTSRQLEEDDEGKNVLPFALGRPAPAAPASQAGRTPPRVARGWQVSALAAGLAGIVGFAGWMNSGQQVRSLRERLAERPAASSPEGAPLVVATADPILLDPIGSKMRGVDGSDDSGDSEATLPAGEASSLQLNSSGEIEPAERAAISSYRLEVLDAGGRKVTEAPVRLLKDGNYSVTVDHLPPGSYELQVYGRSSEGEKAYETYRFKVAG